MLYTPLLPGHSCIREPGDISLLDMALSVPKTIARETLWCQCRSALNQHCFKSLAGYNTSGCKIVSLYKGIRDTDPTFCLKFGLSH